MGRANLMMEAAMPILDEDEMTQSMRKTLAGIRQREKKAQENSLRVRDARSRQVDIERDANLIRETGFSNRGGDTSEMASKKKTLRGVNAGAGQRQGATLVDGTREATDMRRTASRQDLIDRRKTRENPSGTSRNLTERLKRDY